MSAPTPIPLSVTQDDIALARRYKDTGMHPANCCAVVQAFKRLFPNARHISCGLWEISSNRGSYYLSPELTNAAERFPHTEPCQGRLTPFKPAQPAVFDDPLAAIG